MGVRGDRELMRAHVAALFTSDASGRLLAVNEPDGGVAPRFFLGRTARSTECWFRQDLDSDLVRALEAALLQERGNPGLDQPRDDGPTVFEQLLSASAPILKVWAGPAYRFSKVASMGESIVFVTEGNTDVLRPYFEDWLEDVQGCQPFAAVLEDGQAVSLCASVRTTGLADEAGVETHPDFRRRGHAGEATSAWATAVRKLGRTPLYSTSWSNAASRAVAGKLGLVQFGSDLHVT